MEKLQLLICALLRSGESKVDVSNLTLPTDTPASKFRNSETRLAGSHGGQVTIFANYQMNF
jgi:hypothetical protein